MTNTSNDPSSSFAFFCISNFSAFFILCTAINADSIPNRPIELISLLSLKLSLQDPLNTFSDWDYPSSAFSGPVWCSWSGIECNNNTGVITGVDLSGRSLSGNIPDDIRNLVYLRHLNLSSNILGGSLPPALFQFPDLQTLDINHNNFSFTFPPGISRLRSLTHFDAFSNNFTGPLPEDIAELRSLEYLNLGGSYFDGEIPGSYGSLRNLKFLYLAGNLLTGPIPPELGSSNKLEHFQLGSNQYTAGIPPEFGSLSSLVYLDIQSANLSGPLPPELGNLKRLEFLIVYNNSFTGPIPWEFGNLTALTELDLSDNFISGVLPSSLSSLHNLRLLSLMYNNLTGEIPEGFGDLPELEILSLWSNSLSGSLPQRLGSNAKLQRLDVSTNSLSGPIPPHLCQGNRLGKLILFNNYFAGELPASLANCSSLYRIRIQNNNLNGSIPPGLGLLRNLTLMDISQNRFTGPIPPEFGNTAGNLVSLNMSHNSFRGELPDNIWESPSLQIFSASFNNLSGKIPDFTGCKTLSNIELQGNNLSGSIPWNIEHCEKLIMLNLHGNSLSGIIPWEISALPSISDVDLSYNFLSGTIPSDFGNCTTLESFNVSYNRLVGPIPSTGSVFSTLHPSSFTGNEGLCGVAVHKPCETSGPSAGDAREETQPKKKAGPIVWIAAAVFGTCLVVLVVSTRWLNPRYTLKFSGERDIGPWKLTAFQRLNFTANDVLECVTMSDKVIGMGSMGTVYKAEMPSGEIIAVKKLWGKQKETVKKRRGGVLAEVDVLGTVRHRNIVRLLGCCRNGECTMLLYEYMPNGSLHDLLHSKTKVTDFGVDWMLRYKIALGVAQGICYLHHDCNPIIVHRDLKPSNILLDGEMEARVADFGVAKLIQSDESMSVIAGSYGYIAPEYGYTLQVDEKSDIYSYGVVLMEVITGKRSVEAEFGEGKSVVDWVRSKLNKGKDGINEVLDKRMGASSCPLVKEEMMLLLRVALLCTSRNPADRPSMRDVVSMLQAAKPKQLLSAK